MAVLATPREPGALDFVRLKLRLTRNGFRGQPWRVVAFVIGVLFGLWVAGLAVVGFSATAFASVGVALTVAVIAGSALVLAWALFPLLFFGVDETLDPARFALLPLRRATVVKGMFVAAFVGVPAAASLLASAGLVSAAGLRFGAVGAVVALVGALAGLALGVVASRAITSAFAALLRSRRVRDLAIVAVALLASSVAPLQLLVNAAIVRGDIDQAERIARVLAWTPLGAAYALPFDVGEGRFVEAGVRLVIAVGAIGLLLWWWSRTIESAMLATSTGASASIRRTSRGPVAALVPRTLRGLIRPSVFGAIVARESRFWRRDPRRRASLVSLLVATAVLPLVFTLAARQEGSAGLASGLTFGFVVSMAGTLGGMLLANQFSFDGSAYSIHLLAQVPGRVELRARATAIGISALPVQILVVAVVSVLAGVTDQVPTGLGLLAAAFGVSVAVAGLLSVVAAYPLPSSNNPFAVNSGGASAKSLLALAGLVGTIALCLPVIAATVLLADVPGGRWLVLGLGLLYGGAAVGLGTLIAGDLLDRRGPEVLAAVTPRR